MQDQTIRIIDATEAADETWNAYQALASQALRDPTVGKDPQFMFALGIAYQRFVDAYSQWERGL